MILLLIRTLKILIIWGIIGLLGAYGYNYLKPYLTRVKPEVEKTYKSIADKFNNKEIIKPVKQFVKKTLQEPEKVPDKPVVYNKKEKITINNEEPKLKPLVHKKENFNAEKIQVAGNSENYTLKEDEIIQRQINIIDELMN